MSRTRRNLLLVAGAIGIWYIVILFTWALQPLEDSVPVGVNKDNTPVSVTVQCNTLFASTPHDGELPDLDVHQEYNRAPCDVVQSDARKIFALDTLVAVGGVAVLVGFAVRPARARSGQLAGA